eukprot:9221126-Pyramimonas_sp.AAC.1
MEDLEVNARKVRIAFREDLELAASQEKIIGTELFGICMLLRTKVRGDTRVNEQCNSIIRVLNERSRTIGLELLSARVNTKKALGLGTRGLSMRWRSIKPRAEALLDQVQDRFSQATEIVQADGRWSVPNPVPAVDRHELLRVMKVLVPRPVEAVRPMVVDWALICSLKFHREARTATPTIGYRVSVRRGAVPDGDLDFDIQDGDLVYYIAEKNHSASMMVTCTCTKKLDAAKFLVFPRRPLSLISAKDVFIQHYEDIHADPPGGEPQPDKYQQSWLSVSRHKLKWNIDGEALLCASMESRGPVIAALQRRKPKKKTSAAPSSAAPLTDVPDGRPDDDRLRRARELARDLARGDGGDIDTDTENEYDPDLMEALRAELLEQHGPESEDAEHFDEWLEADQKATGEED